MLQGTQIYRFHVRMKWIASRKREKLNKKRFYFVIFLA